MRVSGWAGEIAAATNLFQEAAPAPLRKSLIALDRRTFEPRFYATYRHPPPLVTALRPVSLSFVQFPSVTPDKIGISSKNSRQEIRSSRPFYISLTDI